MNRKSCTGTSRLRRSRRTWRGLSERNQTPAPRYGGTFLQHTGPSPFRVRG